MDINKYVSLAIGIAVIAIVDNYTVIGGVNHRRYGPDRCGQPPPYYGGCCPCKRGNNQYHYPASYSVRTYHSPFGYC